MMMPRTQRKRECVWRADASKRWRCFANGPPYLRKKHTLSLPLPSPLELELELDVDGKLVPKVCLARKQASWLLFGIFIIMPLPQSRIRSTDTYLRQSKLGARVERCDDLALYCAWSTTIQGINHQCRCRNVHPNHHQ